MATFLQRCLQLADYDTDGGAPDLNKVASLFNLYNSGKITASYFKSELDCTTEQAEELQEILDTMPTPFDPQWALDTSAIIWLSFLEADGYQGATNCRSKLGI